MFVLFSQLHLTGYLGLPFYVFISVNFSSGVDASPLPLLMQPQWDFLKRCLSPSMAVVLYIAWGVPTSEELCS